LVEWLWYVLEAKPHWTPTAILETESRYPGLLDDLFTYGWQRAVIKQQIDDDSN
jgi:hypothetical protein